MGIWVLPTANSLDVIRQVRATMPDIEAQLPVGMKVGIPYDATEYIQDAINEVLKTLGETLLIVVIVIFLFLGSFRSVLIPVVAIPISLVGAVFLMLAAGFTINLLTLLAIVLSVGLVVDDAIVMVENVERHLHAGQPPLQAAPQAARELVGPIVAMTITLAAVYTPVGIQGGLTGAAVPRVRVHAGRRGHRVRSGGPHPVADDGLPAPAGRRHRARLRGLDQPALRAGAGPATARTLDATLRTGPSSWPSGRSWSLLSVPFFMFSQKELAPTEDQGVVFGIVQASANSTLDQTKLFAKEIHDVYRSFPESGSIFQITGPTGGFGGMVTKPWSEREKTTEELLVESAGKLSNIPGVRVDPHDAGPPARRRRLPGRPRDRLHRGAPAARGARGPARGEGVRQRPVHLRRRRSQVRPAAGGGGVRPRQGPVTGRRPEPGRARTSRRSSGGDYVNRFSIQGRSYKVIPQVKRSERLTAGAARGDPRHGARRAARPPVHVRHPAARPPSRAS